MHAVLAINLWANLFYIGEIDDRRTVDPKEEIGVQLLFKVSHRLAKQVGLRLRADTHVVLFCAYPADLRDGEEKDAPLGLEYDPRRIRRPIGALPRRDN